MSEHDYWVTEYEGKVCEIPSRHIYRCVRYSEFNLAQYAVGATTEVDEATYIVCDVDRANPAEGEDWLLVYAHYVPDEMSEKDWNGLYGDTELADAG